MIELSEAEEIFCDRAFLNITRSWLRVGVVGEDKRGLCLGPIPGLAWLLVSAFIVFDVRPNLTFFFLWSSIHLFSGRCL